MCLRLPLNLEPGSRAGVCSLRLSLQLTKRRRRGLAWEPFNIPTWLKDCCLGGWCHSSTPGLALWNSDDSRNLEAAMPRWHQTHHVCCTFLVLAQAFPLPGKPTPPSSAFKTECKCLPPRQNQWSPPPCSQREVCQTSPEILLMVYSLLCVPYQSVFLTGQEAGLFIAWSPAPGTWPDHSRHLVNKCLGREGRRKDLVAILNTQQCPRRHGGCRSPSSVS